MASAMDQIDMMMKSLRNEATSEDTLVLLQEAQESVRLSFFNCLLGFAGHMEQIGGEIGENLCDDWELLFAMYCSCPVEMSACLESLQPFHTATASALMTSMLTLSLKTAMAGSPKLKKPSHPTRSIPTSVNCLSTLLKEPVVKVH